MATHPEQFPDSLPADQDGDVERVSPGGGGRESVEDTPGRDNSVDSPGTPGGGGTGGVNDVQEDLDR